MSKFVEYAENAGIREVICEIKFHTISLRRVSKQISTYV